MVSHHILTCLSRHPLNQQRSVSKTLRIGYRVFSMFSFIQVWSLIPFPGAVDWANLTPRIPEYRERPSVPAWCSASLFFSSPCASSLVCHHPSHCHRCHYPPHAFRSQPSPLHRPHCHLSPLRHHHRPGAPSTPPT